MIHSTPEMGILEQLTRLGHTLPEHLAGSDLADLAALLRYAERGCWAFAMYNTVAIRDDVIAVLRALLNPLPVLELTLMPERPDPLVYFEHLPKEKWRERAIVFFFDLERAGKDALELLEQEREILAAYPHGLVFWVTPAGRVQVARKASNFWAQRSGVFDFTVPEPAMLATVRSVWAGAPVRIDAPDDWERQMRLFTGLLAEYEQIGEMMPRQLADLHGKIAYLLHFAGRYAEAADHLRAQLALAEQADDRRLQVEALNNLGRIERIRFGRSAALEYFERALGIAGEDRGARAEALVSIADMLTIQGESAQAINLLDEALALYRAVGDRLGEANVLQASGDVQNFRGETDAALVSYNQALQLYRAVSDRLGEANVLKAIGDAQNFRRETDAALVSYNQALQLYRAVGDYLGEANVLKAIGDVQNFHRETDAALASYDQALQLYRAVGGHLGEANVLKAIGDVQNYRDERDAALASYSQALQLYRAVGDYLDEANVLLSLGDLERSRSEVDEAEDYYQKAKALYEAMDNRYSLARVLYRMGDWHIDRNERRQAIKLYDQAIEMWRSIGMDKLVEEILIPRRKRAQRGIRRGNK